MSNEIVPIESIENRILVIRGQKVMIDRDLAALYGVLTKYLNKQVNRNIERFPKDFMFQISKEEWENLICQFGTSSSRFQIGTLKVGQNIKYLPYAFTEHGILMLSSVLRSPRAVYVNIQIMRTFTKLRRMLATHEELRRKIEGMEKKYDGQFKVVFDAINEMLAEPGTTKVKGVGFRCKG